MTDEFDGLTIQELSALLRARQVSPVELTEAEAEITAGHYRGPLHGVPIGVKDLIDVAGVPCTFGSRILADLWHGSENPHYGFVRNP